MRRVPAKFPLSLPLLVWADGLPSGALEDGGGELGAEAGEGAGPVLGGRPDSR